jgi:hypothetical protein
LSLKDKAFRWSLRDENSAQNTKRMLQQTTFIPGLWGWPLELITSFRHVLTDCLLLFRIQAKAQAVQQGRWLLVNVQSRTEFPSYMVSFPGPVFGVFFLYYLNEF